ncbi:MAG: PIN domain-containing protein [Pseudomonadota bacterium]|nr:PIN domain-containing protein [Pseudomonadota bacterium]
MRLPDTNLLVYSVNASSPFHPVAVSWLAKSFAAPGGVAFAWNALIGFVRIATHPRAMQAPLSVGDATAMVDEWLSQPRATVVNPGTHHADVLFKLLLQCGTGGNLTNDAHLAALAVEHSATVGTFDRDFLKFKGVQIDLLTRPDPTPTSS